MEGTRNMLSRRMCVHTVYIHACSNIEPAWGSGGSSIGIKRIHSRDQVVPVQCRDQMDPAGD